MGFTPGKPRILSPPSPANWMCRNVARPGPRNVDDSERAEEAPEQEIESHNKKALANRERAHTVHAEASMSGAGVVPGGGKGMRRRHGRPK